MPGPLGTPARLSRTTRSLAVALALASLLVVLVPALAHAQAAQSVAETCGTGQRGSGQMDGDGYTYLACGTQVRVFGPNGSPVGAPISTGLDVMDVAPSPDGRVLYVTHAGDRIVRRLVGARGGIYTRDDAWKLENLPGVGGARNGGAVVRGEYVATDASGDLYVS